MPRRDFLRRNSASGTCSSSPNGPDYEVNGVEFDVVVAPLDGLTLTAAGSYNKGELPNSPQLINNIEGSPGFGQPITENCVDGNAKQVLRPKTISPRQDVYGPEGD